MNAEHLSPNANDLKGVLRALGVQWGLLILVLTALLDAAVRTLILPLAPRQGYRAEMFAALANCHPIYYFALAVVALIVSRILQRLQPATPGRAYDRTGYVLALVGAAIFCYPFSTVHTVSQLVALALITPFVLIRIYGTRLGQTQVTSEALRHADAGRDGVVINDIVLGFAVSMFLLGWITTYFQVDHEVVHQKVARWREHLPVSEGTRWCLLAAIAVGLTWLGTLVAKRKEYQEYLAILTVQVVLMLLYAIASIALVSLARDISFGVVIIASITWCTLQDLPFWHGRSWLPADKELGLTRQEKQGLAQEVLVPVHQLPWIEFGRGGLCALVPAITILACYCFANDFSLSEDDSVSSYQPLVIETLRSLTAGEIPLWSDYSDCGIPHLARGQSLTLYPGHLLPQMVANALGKENLGIALAHALHISIGTFFSWVFLRKIGCGIPASVLGTLGFAFSGPLYGFWTNWNSYAHLAAYVPMTIYLIERQRNISFRLFEVLLLGFSAAQMFMLCDPLLLVKYLLLVVAYAVLRFPQQFRFSYGLMIVMSGAIGAFCGSAQCLATAEYVGMTQRVVDIGEFDRLVFMSLRPEHFAGLLNPLAQIDWPSSMHPGFLQGAAIFVGPMIPFALVGLFFVGRCTDSPLRALLILCAIYAILSLGISVSVNQWLSYIPLIKHMRWPARWTVELCSLLPLVLGIGIQGLLAALDRPRAILGAVIALFAIGFAVVECDGVSLAGVASRYVAILYVTPAIALVVMQVYGKQQWWIATAIGWSVVSLLVSIQLAQVQRFSLGHRTWYGEAPEIPLAHGGRILNLIRWVDRDELAGSGMYSMNLPHQYRHRTVFGYTFPFVAQTWRDGISFQAEVYAPLVVKENYLVPEHASLLDMLHVEYVLVHEQDKFLRRFLASSADFGVETRHRQLCFYRRNPSDYRGAWFVQTLELGDDVVEIDDLKRADLRQKAFVDRKYQGTLSFTSGGKVHSYSEERGTLRLEVTSLEDGFLVISHSWYPGWRAWADGAEVDVVRTNSAFLGAAIPAGTKSVVLQYRPAWLIRLLIANWTVLGLVFAMIVVDSAALIAQGRALSDQLGDRVRSVFRPAAAAG